MVHSLSSHDRHAISGPRQRTCQGISQNLVTIVSIEKKYNNNNDNNKVEKRKIIPKTKTNKGEVKDSEIHKT